MRKKYLIGALALTLIAGGIVGGLVKAADKSDATTNIETTTSETVEEKDKPILDEIKEMVNKSTDTDDLEKNTVEDLEKKEMEKKFDKTKDSENIKPEKKKEYLNIGSHYFELNFNEDKETTYKLEFDIKGAVEITDCKIVEAKGKENEINDDKEFTLKDKGIYRVEYKFGIEALDISSITTKVLNADKVVDTDVFKINDNYIKKLRERVKQLNPEVTETREKKDGNKEPELPKTSAVM